MTKHSRIPQLIIFVAFFVSMLAGNGWAAQTRTVTDMAGRKVVIPLNVKAVVTAGGTPAISAFIFALGKGETIKNGLPSSMHGKRWAFQTVFAPNLKNQPVVAGPGPAWVPDIEMLMTLPHDLILVDSEISARKLEQKGFKVIYLNWRDRDCILKSMQLLGEVFNRERGARDYRKYYHDMERRIAARVAAVPPGRRPKVLYCRFSTFSLPMLSTTSRMFEKAGGIPAVGGEIKVDNANFSPEQLINWNPDLLIVWSAEEIRAVYQDHRISSVSAVRNRRVYSMPMGAHVWSHFTPEQPLAWLWLAKRLYPDRFRQVDMEKETLSFYRRFMGRTLTTGQIREVLGQR